MIYNFLEEHRDRFDVFALRNGFYFIQGRYSEIRQKLLDGINETSKDILNKKESIKIQTYARSILLSNCLSKDKKHLREDVKLFSDISDPDIGVFTDFLYLMAWSHLIIGDSVSFKEFQKRTQELIIEKDLTLLSETGADNTTIDGSNETNGGEALNVLDIVLLVEIILGG